jgi:hypothetical protein
MRLFTILFLAVFMAGCAQPNVRLRYSHPTANRDRFDDVSYQCQQKSQKTVSKEAVTAYGVFSPEDSVVNCDKFNACMAKYGFEKSSDGMFVTAKDMVLDCK